MLGKAKNKEHIWIFNYTVALFVESSNKSLNCNNYPLHLSKKTIIYKIIQSLFLAKLFFFQIKKYICMQYNNWKDTNGSMYLSFSFLKKLKEHNRIP